MSIDPAGSSKIPALAITLADVNAAEVTAGKIVANAITPAMLPISAITVDRLSDGGVA